MRSCEKSSLRGSGDSHNEAIHTYCHSERSEESKKSKQNLFGYFAYAQYDNEKIKRNGLPRLAFASLAMTNQPISSLRGDSHESPKQNQKPNK